MKTLLRQLTATTLAALFICSPTALLAQTSTTPPDDDDEDVIMLSPFEVSGSSVGGGYTATSTLAGSRMGATAGGAQDINFFRSGAGRGEVPHPNAITAEGLFSEHDLPLDLGGPVHDLFVLQSAAIPAHFEVLPEVTHLAQIGFSSNLDAATWQRTPLNLVAVIDKSGSMSGHPLELVRASLHEVLRQLNTGDQLTIVLYGDRAHVHLPTTTINPATRLQVDFAIDAIASRGSTAMEAGLTVGYDVARQSARDFAGTTRVMLFTDERPNVGDTSAAGFMGMAEHASRDGIGLTTIGVGVQFGVELADRIAGVRGGNLFFFPNANEMTKTFTDDFDTMVSELAYDFRVRIEPARGTTIAGVFGVPSNLLRWDGRAIVFDIATIFLSKRRGGIYFALSRDARLPDSAAPLSRIAFSYSTGTSATRHRSETDVHLLAADQPQLGLTRGHALIDEYLTLRSAASAHLFDNDQEQAYQLTRDLVRRLDQLDDPSLESERTLVRNLHETFAFLSGHTAETRLLNKLSPLVGLWRSHDDRRDETVLLEVQPDGTLRALVQEDPSRPAHLQASWLACGRLPSSNRAQFAALGLGDEQPTTLRYVVRDDWMSLDVTLPDEEPERTTFIRVDPEDAPQVLAGEPNSADPIERATVDGLTGLPLRS